MKTNGIVVVNLHDVLIDFQYQIYKDICSEWTNLCGLINFPEFLKHDEFLNRTIQNSFHLLMKDKTTYNNKTEYIYRNYKAQQIILKNIIENEKFYPSCNLLNFAKKSILKPSFIDSSKIKKVIILIDGYSEKQKKNALDFCRKVFDHPKINFITVEHNKKAEFVLNKLKIFTLYVDHNINNIRKISEKMVDLNTCEFIIPRYDFNTMPLDLSILIHGKGGSFTYYSEKD